jgi:hypothetical protein
VALMSEQQQQEMRPWPADKVERWSLDRIKPYPRNARLHSEEQVEQIAASMRKFGVTAPVLVDEDGVLIFGHGRLRAAQKLGLAELPVSVAAGWPEDDKRAYRITDNQLALNSEWDLPMLKVELQELKLHDFDMPLLGLDDVKLVGFLAGATPPSEFREFDENVPTEHQCPKCGYKWSGRPDAGGDGG